MVHNGRYGIVNLPKVLGESGLLNKVGNSKVLSR